MPLSSVPEFASVFSTQLFSPHVRLVFPAFPLTISDSVRGNDRSPAHPLLLDLQRLQQFYTVMESLAAGMPATDIEWPASTLAAGKAQASLMSQADDFLASLEIVVTVSGSAVVDCD